MSLFSSPWQETFIASLTAIFPLPLHNSESNHSGCSRRCKNAKSRIAAPCAGIPTRLWGRTPYGLRCSSPGHGTTTIWRGETLANLRAGASSAVIPSCMQTASVTLSRPLASPFLTTPAGTSTPACFPQRVRPTDLSLAKVSPTQSPPTAVFQLTPFPHSAVVCQSNQSFKALQRSQQCKKKKKNFYEDVARNY